MKHGFTLVELSIVLVIIGLVVGGVMVGQYLVHAAHIRATLTQMSKLNTAVNAFRDKFDGLPGDLQGWASAGMYDPVVYYGLGNGMLQDSGNFSVVYDAEIGAFFADLSRAGMLEVNNMVQATDATPTTSSQATLATMLLPAALGNTNYIWVTGGQVFGAGNNIDMRSNYFHIAGVTTFTTGGANMTTAMKMTPTDAAAIDNKLDDGVPNTGSVQANDDTTGDVNLTPGASHCSSAVGVYDVAAHPLAYECSLVILAGF